MNFVFDTLIGIVHATHSYEIMNGPITINISENEKIILKNIVREINKHTMSVKLAGVLY
jgi:hypothetical protein